MALVSSRAKVHAVMTTDDERAQEFVDTGDYSTDLHLSRWPSISTLPLRIPSRVSAISCVGCTRLTTVTGLQEGITSVDFSGCTSLTSVTGMPESVTTAFFKGCTALVTVVGLPESVTIADFFGCTSLRSMTGLPVSVTYADFTGCTSLTSVVGLSMNVKYAMFNECTSLTSVHGLPESVKYAYFDGCTSIISVLGLPESCKYAVFSGCTRLRRAKSDWRYLFDEGFDPAREVHALMVSGVSDKLLSNQVGIGHDVALLIGRFVTSGMNSTDRMETVSQVRTRYFSS